MMKKSLTRLAAWFMACAAFTVSAGEVEVRKAAEPLVGPIEKIAKSPIAGLWEVTASGQVFYVDDKGGYLLSGNLVDLKSGRNLTAERQFNALPLELAIKQVRGNGKNVLVTFEDPNCGYCKKLAKEMKPLTNITIYTFLYPVLGEDSTQKSKAIWCSPDKNKAWVDWMLAGKLPTAADSCDTTGLDKSLELGRKLRIAGTPALFFATGERVGGYIPASEIEQRFNAKGG
jgi:thiol:disulfide interchange protein DsbC